MQVLHVISDENIGGAGVLLVNLLRHFDRRKIESTVALPRGSRLRMPILQTGTPVVELEFDCSRVGAASVGELVRVIQAIDPEIVHTSAAFNARIAARLCGKKIIYTRHCSFPAAPALPVFRQVRNGANAWLCDCAVGTANAAAKDLRETGIPQRKIRIIFNGCEEVRKIKAGELELCRAKYGIAEGDFCVGICARLEACKGHDVFLRAAKLATLAIPDLPFRFLIIGEGSRRAQLEAMANQLGIASRVVFTGFVRDPAPLYRILQIHVNCSVGTETSCLAVSEGMSAGIPTILSDYGGNREMLRGSGAGYCVPQGNAAALAAAICKLATHAQLRREMGKQARLCYEQNYTADRMAKQLTAVYLKLVR